MSSGACVDDEGISEQLTCESTEKLESADSLLPIMIQAPSSTESLSYGQNEEMSSFHSEPFSAISPLPASQTRIKQKCMMPWWCVFLPWTMVLTVCSTCAFFTILYSFNYGLEKSLQWLKSLICSFFVDIFFEQPLKVIGMSLFIAIILKKPANIELPRAEVLEANQDEGQSLLQYYMYQQQNIY